MTPVNALTQRRRLVGTAVRSGFTPKLSIPKKSPQAFKPRGENHILDLELYAKNSITTLRVVIKVQDNTL
ncbi:hypothetical protein MJO29_009243 [Puccinia striiformis f. sp. tritici]|nr:hypothetical protein MJO29_009243 [Puccinia striiformis f. sp. tritici]